MQMAQHFDPYRLLLKNPGPIAKEIRQEFVKALQFQFFYIRVINIYYLLPIIRFVTDYLSPIDLINLSASCLAFHFETGLQQSILPSFKRNISILLNEGGHFTVSRDLSQVLCPGTCVLSGSIVLQAILGVQWKGSDVDIYCLRDKPLSVHDFLLSRGYDGFDQTMDFDESYYFMITSVMHIDNVHDYNLSSNTGTKIQVIDMNPNISAESCVEHFDLDIVQNYFNGTELFVKSVVSLTNRYAKVQRHIQLVTKTIGKATGSLAHVLMRLLKLHSDGVVQLNLENWDPFSAPTILKSIFVKIFSRFQKYSLRGFLIADENYLWTKDNIRVVLMRLRKTNMKHSLEVTLHFMDDRSF